MLSQSSLEVLDPTPHNAPILFILFNLRLIECVFSVVDCWYPKMYWRYIYVTDVAQPYPRILRARKTGDSLSVIVSGNLKYPNGLAIDETGMCYLMIAVVNIHVV